MAHNTDENPFDDDFDDGIDITDLDTSTNEGHFKALGLPHWTTRQRKINFVVVILLFLFVGAIFLWNVPGARQILGYVSPTPTPTAPVSANMLFYLEGNPSWGHFSIDGRAVTHLPVIGRDSPLQLTPGTHQITWHIAPFRSQSCSVAVFDRVTYNGSCLSRNGLPHVYANRVIVIKFFASMGDLDVEQRASLTSQIQQVLTSYTDTEGVQTGELYAISEQEARAHSELCHSVSQFALCYAQAKQPLRATVTMQIDNGTSPDDPCVLLGQCFSGFEDCRSLCEDPAVSYGDRVATDWEVSVIVVARWSYATLAGQMIASNQPDSAIRGTVNYHTISLHITQDQQGWHVSFWFGEEQRSSDNPICQQAMADITSFASAAFPYDQYMIVQQTSFLVTHRAAGCLALVGPDPNDLNATPTPTPASGQPEVAYCLLRFGVILAANDTAHSYWPDLPVASAYEKTLAQRFLDTIPFSS